MRSLFIKHKGKKIELVATFAASMELADRVEDPMFIVRESALEDTMLRARIPYEPKFSLTARNIPEIIHIGINASDKHDMTLEEVQELVFDAGFMVAKMWCAQYLAMIVEPKPTIELEEEPDDEVGDQPEKPLPKAGKAA